MHDSIWLVLLFPLLGALICATQSRELGRTATSYTACGAILLAFLAAFQRFLHYTTPTETVAWKWLDLSFPVSSVGVSPDQVPTIPIEFGALVDPLSLTMLCVVTGVAFLIHCFSTGYMADEPDYGRYFGCLNLFVATMVCLVMANNLVMLLIGWGGVGFASYSLIGFWNQKPSAVLAARKAFVINTVGDIGLMFSIFLVASLIGNFRYTQMMPGLTTIDPRLGHWAFFIGLGLLIAAYAKSAQLPFHTWLPDAMEGPTPVSALIHAATMVTAGVYLLVRCHPIFEAAPTLMPFIAGMGALTAIAAATAALVQTDLKRILAYSTMSQLGYMFMACGVGAYGAAMFHLVTHAFFKALLFLSAGVVIHSLHGEQDIRKMGGLHKQLPLTHVVFLFGSLALAGIPIFAGFFSKEAILSAVGQSKETYATLYWIVGLVTAALTAYYTGRAYLLTFWGPAHHGLTQAVEPVEPTESIDHEAHQHEGIHLPGASMEWPILVLGILTLVAGFFQTPFFGFEGYGPEAESVTGMFIAVGLALIGVAAAFALHRKGADVVWPETMRSLLAGCWGFDALYTLVFSRGIRRLSVGLTDTVDPVFSQSLPEQLASSTLQFGEVTGQVQNGNLRRYALVFILAVGFLLVYSFVRPLFGGLT
jgi:NADH-quinone oxidoreductase subunit L